MAVGGTHTTLESKFSTQTWANFAGCVVTDVSSWVHPNSRTPNDIDLDPQVNGFPEH